MKILFVSDNPIKGFGGGSVENRKHYDALKRYCESTDADLKVISRDVELSDTLGIAVQKNRSLDILARLAGHSTYLYFTWIYNINLIKKYNPDILYLGRSRFGFMAKKCKKILPECKVITNIDNVEVDYIDGYFGLKKGVKNKLYRILESFCVKRDEKDAILYSDYLVYLTKRNVLRICKLYKREEKNPIIIPICLESESELTLISSKKTVAFIGSLDYAANILAVKNILNLWENEYAMDNRLELLIAGRNPSKDVVDSVKRFQNVRLVKNYKNITDVIPRYTLMLAPIEKGAGMKVKVAETLSMGLMIVASDEALVGYEEALEECGNGIIRANSLGEFKNAIDVYLQMNDQDLEKILLNNKKIFKKYYSFNRSRSCIKKIINIIAQKGE